MASDTISIVQEVIGYMATIFIVAAAAMQLVAVSILLSKKNTKVNSNSIAAQCLNLTGVVLWALYAILLVVSSTNIKGLSILIL